MKYPLRAGGETLDETHCFWVMCPHPCCWEAEQRVTRGAARRRIPSRTPARSRAVLQDESPSLNIVDASEWADTRKPLQKKMFCETFSSESCHLLTSQSQFYNQSQSFVKDTYVMSTSLNDLQFPDLGSAAKNQNHHSSDLQRKHHVRLSQAKISPLDRSSGALCDSVSVVVWVPNPKHIPHVPSQRRQKSPHITVRNLTCSPSSHLYDIPKLNKKDPRNTRKTENLLLTCSHLASPNGRPSALGDLAPHTLLHTSNSNLTGLSQATDVPMEADLTVGGNRRVPLLEPDVEPWPRLGPTAKVSGACLRSKPAAVLSEKNVAEGPDWLRLRTQKYLSKKHNLRQNVISDKTVLAPPLPPTPWACTQRPSKASLQRHYRSSLETAAAALC